MEFVFIKGGPFEVDDIFDEYDRNTKPVYEVHVDRFWIGKFLVTQGQWKKLMGHNPSVYKNGDNYPVEHVSWHEVQEFICRLNQKSEMDFRLPTEEEWEYTARSGGKKEKWAGTSNESELTEYAWYAGNSNGETHLVGEKNPNDLGLYDMCGNVWEWVQEYYGAESQKMVIRGGSFFDKPIFLKTSYRCLTLPDDKTRFIGFRLVLPSDSKLLSDSIKKNHNIQK